MDCLASSMGMMFDKYLNSVNNSSDHFKSVFQMTFDFAELEAKSFCVNDYSMSMLSAAL